MVEETPTSGIKDYTPGAQLRERVGIIRVCLQIQDEQAAQDDEHDQQGGRAKGPSHVPFIALEAGCGSCVLKMKSNLSDN